MEYAVYEMRALEAFQVALAKKIPGARIRVVQDEVIVDLPAGTDRLSFDEMANMFNISGTVTGRMSHSTPNIIEKVVSGRQDKTVPPQPFIWKMANGCQVRIQDMEDSHIVNCIKLIRQVHAQGNLEAMNTMPTRGVGGPFRPQYMSYGLETLVNRFKKAEAFHVTYGGNPATARHSRDEDICSRKPMYAHLLLEAIRRGL